MMSAKFDAVWRAVEEKVASGWAPGMMAGIRDGGTTEYFATGVRTLGHQEPVLTTPRCAPGTHRPGRARHRDLPLSTNPAAYSRRHHPSNPSAGDWFPPSPTMWRFLRHSLRTLFCLRRAGRNDPRSAARWAEGGSEGDAGAGWFVVLAGVGGDRRPQPVECTGSVRLDWRHRNHRLCGPGTDAHRGAVHPAPHDRARGRFRLFLGAACCGRGRGPGRRGQALIRAPIRTCLSRERRSRPCVPSRRLPHVW